MDLGGTNRNGTFKIAEGSAAVAGSQTYDSSHMHETTVAK